MRRLLLPLVLFAAAATFLSTAPQRVVAGGKDKPHLEYRRTYAEALLEGRVRNVPVFVTRHKDD